MKIQVITNSPAPNGVLHFKSRAEFEKIAESVKNDQLDLRSLIPANFKSLSNLLSNFENTVKIDNQNTLIKFFQNENSKSLSSNNKSAVKSMSNDQSIENGSIDDFIASSYESLVPDDVFQQFLNQDLQIMVGSALYQVTPLGTFEVQLYNID